MEKLKIKELNYALYGLMLGDGNYKGGKIVCEHTNKQRFYVSWLEDMFKNQGLNVTSKYDYIRHTTFGNVMYSKVSIAIENKFYFEKENKFFNENGKKIISDYVLDNINELGILLWFLDDGQWHVSFKNNGAKRFGYLNTQSFTYEENLKILNMFKKRFDIDLRIHKDNSGFDNKKVYYRLYFNATAFRKFYDIVRNYLEYIPKEFYYKFNMQYSPNRIKKSVEYSKKYNLI